MEAEIKLTMIEKKKRVIQFLRAQKTLTLERFPKFIILSAVDASPHT